MLIEFCCPACLAPLSLEPKVAGGQVNCPKCLKLILIPEKTVLGRHGEASPFSPSEKHAGDAASKAISLSVEPYRRELETKTGLLNDAVDMIKTRNQRIKEIESLILKTQKDLWALDVEHDDHKTELDRMRHQLDQRVIPTGLSPEEKEKSDKEREAREARIAELEETKETLKHRLAILDAHARMQRHELEEYKTLIDSLGTVGEYLHDNEAFLEKQQARLLWLDQDMSKAGSLLARAAGALEGLQNKMAGREQLRLAAEQERQILQTEMQTLVHSSSQDVQYALKERDQWKHRAEEQRAELDALREQTTRDNEQLSKHLADLKAEFHHQETLLEDALRVQQDLGEDRRQALTERKELEQSLELLRKRLEQERHELHLRKEEEKSALLGEAAKRESALEHKLKQLRADFSEQETRLEEALRNQSQLAEQSLRSEKQRSELKKQLDLALERLEALGQTVL